MTYVPYYAGGWKDYPDTTTPVTAAALTHIEDGITAGAGIPAPASPATNDGLVYNGSAWVNAKLVNANIDAAAAIARSKLDFGSGLVNADIATGAAIAKAKLASLAIVNADVDPAAAISYSKLALATSIVNGDISASAAIALSKLADPGAGNVVTSAGAGAIAAKPPGYEFSYVEKTSSTSVTATSSATANTVVTAAAVSFDGATVVKIEFEAGLINKGTSWMRLVLYDGSTELGWFGQVADQPFNRALRITPSNASHTYSVRAFVDAGTGTVNAGSGASGSFYPTYIRITKV